MSELRNERRGMILGVVGVLIFSITLPATRIALVELNPITVGIGRSAVAAIFAALILMITRQPWPDRDKLGKLLIAGIGIVLGFPLFTALDMEHVDASHGGVVVGLLPLATALCGVVVSGDRPSPKFWVIAALGSLSVLVFSFIQGAGSLQLADAWLVIACLLGAMGYALGGELAKTMGGWQVICWALVVSQPFILPFVVWQYTPTMWDVSWQTGAGFLYVCLFSQLIGFFPWYKGLALGGVARVSQTQLLQPFFTIAAAMVLLGETLDYVTAAFAVLVIGLVAAGRRAAVVAGGKIAD